MDIIGRHLLPDFWQSHSESESALRGALAIVAAAEWGSDDDLRQQLGFAVTLESEGRALVTDPDGRFRLSLRVDYARRLVHILAIQGDEA